MIVFHSQAYQDKFVYFTLGRIDRGTYLDIGSGHPTRHSNTATLDKIGWTGICIDSEPHSYKEVRNCVHYGADALTLDYTKVLESMPRVIDYLSLDVDEASFECLKRLPLDQYKFKIITIEHDGYRFGDTLRGPQRELLSSLGYVMAHSDVTCEPLKEDQYFEDWWIHPEFVSPDFRTEKQSAFAITERLSMESLNEYELQLRRIQNPPMEGWCTLEKSTVLFNLVETYRPNKIVEIGVFGGRSVVAMALGCKSIDHGFIVGIDPWDVQSCLEGTHPPEYIEWWSKINFSEIASSYRKKLDEFGVTKYVSHIQLHDRDVAPMIAPRSIDMIHFDSNHSPEESEAVVYRWFPKLNNGAIIVMDDINYHGQDPAVKTLFELGVIEIDCFSTYAVYRKP